MNVKLISVTQPLVPVQGPNLLTEDQGTIDVHEGLIREMTAEELLVYIARVSNPGNQWNKATSDKLIAFLIRQKHWSPFDMINMCVEVVTSKAIGIQILRHWSIKPQEFSQRYAEVTDIEPIQLRKNGSHNRQSSTIEFDPIIPYNLVSSDNLLQNTSTQGQPASSLISLVNNSVKTLYKALLHEDVAKECARMILPMATSTTMYLNGSLRSWIHYMEQRCDEHAQLEHQEVANEIKKIFIEQFPMTAKALELV